MIVLYEIKVIFNI